MSTQALQQRYGTAERFTLRHFHTWKEVLAYARTGAPLYYQAPMNYQPSRLTKFQVKAKTIRIWPPGSEGRGRNRTADPFTADAHHLDRFRGAP